MTSPIRNAQKMSIIPAGMAAAIGRFARRRLSELSGIAIAILVAGTLLALASYDPGDPSINTAVGGAPRNLMGLPGAWTADILMQTMGLAAWLVALLGAAWAWRLLSHRGLGRLWLRIAMVPAALLLASIALGAVPKFSGWPLFSGLGGVTGDILLSDIVFATARLGLTASIVGWIAGALAIVALASAMGLSGAEWSAMARFSWQSARSATSSVAAAIGIGRNVYRAGHGVVARGGAAIRGRRGRVEPHFDDGDTPPTRRRPPVRKEPLLAEPEPKGNAEPIVAPRNQKPASGKRAIQARQAKLAFDSDGNYELPPLDLLEVLDDTVGERGADEGALEQNARLLETVLDDFGVRGEIVKVRPGPVVTLYELEPAPGTKSSRVVGLADDIARSMSAVSVRVAVIPGRNVIGIELPNLRREIVSLRELLGSAAYERTAGQLTLVLGKDIGGGPVLVDLSRMPHLLIAGTTGSGKSVAINTMILSLLFRLTPEQCRFIMIDPKMLELSVYDGIPHLLSPVVTDPSKAVVALRWTVREMEDRYRAMSSLGVRNIAGYNARLAEARRKGETLNRTVQTGFDRESGAPIYEDHPLDLEPLPFIVVIVDEMADLMLIAGKDVEQSVQRLAQMARAAGIHLIMATQRPSVDVITGTIKANFPTRVSFQVTSKIDSRTILGEGGAEQLLGDGDMLYMAGGGRISRVHGPFVTDEEVEEVVAFLKSQGDPEYVESITDGDGQESFVAGVIGGGGENVDELYDQAVALVCRERKASTSFVQRHLQIGYNRAARIVERMESEGVVSGANHVGKREVLARDIDDRST